MSDICRSNEYAGECWIDREDVTPPINQLTKMGGRAKVRKSRLKDFFEEWKHQLRRSLPEKKHAFFSVAPRQPEAPVAWSKFVDDDPWRAKRGICYVERSNRL